MINDVFLDFLNRESRQMYGLFTNTLPTLHVELLNEVINVAIFLCNSFCVMPPLFIADDELVQKSLARCTEFLTERLIIMPLREESLDAYFAKKKKEYGQFSNMYPLLLGSYGQEILKRYPMSLISRSSRVGEEIVKAWEEGPDKNEIWKKLISGVQPHEVERIRKIARLVLEKGFAITWPAIKNEVGDNIGVDPMLLRTVLQHHYFSVYIHEFNLRVVTRVPFARDMSFNLESSDLGYDYEAVKIALRAIGLWNIVRSMSARCLIYLRTKNGYINFRQAFNEIAGKTKLNNQVVQSFAIGAEQVSSALQNTEILNKYNTKLSLPYGTELTDEEIDAVNERLKAISIPAVEAFRVIQTKGLDKKSHRKIQKTKTDKTIAIFAALPMERKRLSEFLDLKGNHIERVFTGYLGPTRIYVYGPNEMGRVPAAVETMNFLFKCHDCKPNLIVIAGIAGGFKDEGVELGHIIIARRIIDLAPRKIKTKRKITIPEFRPLTYQTDERIQNYLEYNPETLKGWLQNVISDVGWPKGQKPVIHYGDIASLDEVVSSEKWTRKLLDAWPKLLGVEMEAGGVCAAAQLFNVPVTVIRGVSDYADPSKSDTIWRELAMKTVIHLLEHIEYDLVL